METNHPLTLEKYKLANSSVQSGKLLPCRIVHICQSREKAFESNLHASNENYFNPSRVTFAAFCWLNFSVSTTLEHWSTKYQMKLMWDALPHIVFECNFVQVNVPISVPEYFESYRWYHNVHYEIFCIGWIGGFHVALPGLSCLQNNREILCISSSSLREASRLNNMHSCKI